MSILFKSKSQNSFLSSKGFSLVELNLIVLIIGGMMCSELANFNILLFSTSAFANKNLKIIVKKAKQSDYSSISKIFEYRKDKDGASAAGYQNIIEDLYKTVPFDYIHAADQYFKGDLSCAVHLVSNEASNIDAKQIAKIASSKHPNDVKLKKFYKLLKQQDKALKGSLNSEYLDCKD